MASNFDYDPAWKPEGQGSSSFDFDPNWAPTKKPEGGLVASLKQTGGQMVKSAGQLAADVLPGVDRDNALTRTGQGIIDANPTAVHSLADVADSPWTATKEAVGNAAASVSGVVGARLLGQGLTAAAPLAGPAAPLVAGIGQGISWLGPTAMAALPSYGGIREQQIAADPNNEGSLASKVLAGAGAATVGLIENRFGPQEWALKALSQGGRDALAKQFAANSLAGAIGKGAVKGAAIEGAEELVQNPVEQLASYQDPTTAANLQDTAFGGVMGALGGGVLGGGAGGLSRTITPSQQEQPTQPPQPAIDPNAGPLSKAASMATQTPELNPLAFTPMQPTGPELETDAQTQERLRAAQFQADALPFEPSLSFEQGPQPVRAMNQDGMPFEHIGPEDYDTLNPIRVGEGELLDAERPTAGRTRAPDAIEGQDQRRIGIADDGQQGNQSPMRTLGERVQPAQGENAPTLALPYFTDQKAEQSARKALPFATEQGAQKKAAELSKKRNEPFTVIPHPALADRFAVVPFRNLRTPNEQGQAAQLAARAQAGQPEAMPRVEQGTQQSAPDGIAAPAPATPVQTQPATESVTNGLPPAQKLAQEAEAARGQEGAAAEQQAAPAVAGTADNEVVRALRHSKEFIARFKDNPSELKKQQRFTAAAEKKFGISKIAGYRGGLTVHVADRNDGNATVYMQGPSGNFLEAGTIPLSKTAVYGGAEQPAQNQRSESAQPQAPQAPQFDVSTRTDDQLRYLTVSGKPGWKEAAQTELARRQGTPQGERNGRQGEGRREEVAPSDKPRLMSMDEFARANPGMSERRSRTRWAVSVTDAIEAGQEVPPEIVAELLEKEPKFAPDVIASREVLMDRYQRNIDESINAGIARLKDEHAKIAKTLDHKSVRTNPQKYDEVRDKLYAIMQQIESLEQERRDRIRGNFDKTPNAEDYLVRRLVNANGLSEQAAREKVGRASVATPEKTSPESVVQEATHKDPGKPAEPVTAPVIAQAIQKSARNTEFNPVEARNWLMGEIDKAIENVPPAAADIEADMRREKAKKFVLSDRVKRLSPSKTRDTLEKQERDEFEFRQRDAIAKLAGQIGFVTFDVPGDGKFKVVNTVEKLNDFKAKVKSSPGFAKNPDRPTTYGSGLAGGQNLDQQVADAKKFGGDPLADIGNAIEIARLKNSKDADTLLDRFKEASGGKDYDAWRAEQEAADEIAAREAEAREKANEGDPQAFAEMMAMYQQPEAEQNPYEQGNLRDLGEAAEKAGFRVLRAVGRGQNGFSLSDSANPQESILIGITDDGPAIITDNDRRGSLRRAVRSFLKAYIEGGKAPAEQSPSDRFRAEVERRKQEREQEFVHNGVRIYPATMNVAGERKQMWGIESSENKAKREAGERYGFGDSLFDTKEQATAAADRQIKSDSERADLERQRTEEESHKATKAAERKADTINGFLEGKAPNTQELIRKALDKQYRFDGAVRSVRQQVEWLNENGALEVSTFEEPKIKPMSRTQFNRASQREQDAHEKKMREAGTKTVYLVSGLELGKYAYDYAQHLIARKTAAPQQAQEQPKQAEQSSSPAAQEAQPEQAESFPVNSELQSLFESLDGTSTRKANKAKKAIQSDQRADKINMVQDKFLDILQALEDSGAVKINCK